MSPQQSADYRRTDEVILKTPGSIDRYYNASTASYSFLGLKENTSYTVEVRANVVADNGTRAVLPVASFTVKTATAKVTTKAPAPVKTPAVPKAKKKTTATKSSSSSKSSSSKSSSSSKDTKKATTKKVDPPKSSSNSKSSKKR
jgi:hypothetical protein